MHWLELKVPPLLVWLGCAGAMFGVARLAPQFSFATSAGPVIALLLVAVGAAFALAGVVEFRRGRTTVNPLRPSASSTLVRSGVYRVSRNPMYLGFLLALAGWAVFLANAIAALVLPAFVAYMTQFQIKAEERALLAIFGSEFAQYMSSVRRWV